MPSVPTVREPHPDDYDYARVAQGIVLGAVWSLVGWALVAWWLW